MNMPGFTAEQSLHAVRGRYRSGRPPAAASDVVVPAIPRCENCPGLLQYCVEHPGRSRAACAACAAGRCDSSDETGEFCFWDPILNRMICP
jgi:hypothetical protein